MKQSEQLERHESSCRPCAESASSPVCGSDGHNYASQVTKKNFLHLLLLGYWCVSPKKNQRVDKSFQIINVGQSSAVSCCVDTDAGAAGRRSSSPLTGGQVPLLGAALWLMMNVFPTASLLTNPHSGFLLIYIRFLILTLHEETVGNDSSVWLPFSKCTVSSEWVIFLPRSPS